VVAEGLVVPKEDGCGLGDEGGGEQGVWDGRLYGGLGILGKRHFVLEDGKGKHR
jgi:hypothetical protein